MRQAEKTGSFYFYPLNLDVAKIDHVSDICDLINLSYRGEFGWTRESHIIQGDRVKRPEIIAAILNPKTHFFVVYSGKKLLSCVCVSEIAGSAHIGFFSVHPDLQKKGLGKRVLELAEAFASKQLNTKKYVLFVVSQRPELISFYKRRGYSQTGRIETYPLRPGNGVPYTSGLTIEYLEKKANNLVG